VLNKNTGFRAQTKATFALAVLLFVAIGLVKPVHAGPPLFPFPDIESYILRPGETATMRFFADDFDHGQISEDITWHDEVDVEISSGLPAGASVRLFDPSKPCPRPGGCVKAIEWTPSIGDVGNHTLTATATSIRVFTQTGVGVIGTSIVEPPTQMTIKIVVTDLEIDSMEVTQAIQVNQTPDELKKHLEDNGGKPPVPIVAGKPGVLRVYLTGVSQQTKATIQVLTLEPGGFLPDDLEIENKTVTLSPLCTAEDRRRSNRNIPPATCDSVNFYSEEGGPPQGTSTVWVFLIFGEFVAGGVKELPNLQHTEEQEARGQAHFNQPGLDFNDPSNFASIIFFPPILNRFDTHKFTSTVKESDELVLRAVSVCHSVDALGNWQCVQPAAPILRRRIGLLRKIAPTHSVKVEATGHKVRLRLVGDLNHDVDLDDCHDTNGDGRNDACEGDIWWELVAKRIDSLFTVFDRSVGGILGIQKYYYGMVAPDADLLGDTLGIAHELPSRGALSLTRAVDDQGMNVTQDTVAHETAHMLRRQHTNTETPATHCGLSEGDPQWPYGDNRIQSGHPIPDGAPLKSEVGFDVTRRRAVTPTDVNDLIHNNMFDVMSYCVPVWVSPFTYVGLLDVLDPPPPLPVGTPGTFWLVSGFLEDLAVDFQPLFTFDAIGPLETGAGTHRIEVRDASGLVLFTRFFIPSVAHTRVAGGGRELRGRPAFSELIPMQESAASIVLIDNTGVDRGLISIGGIAPTVNIISPTGGTLDGIQSVEWSVSDPDSDNHTFWIDYSPDGGTTWRNLDSALAELRLRADFDDLPGSIGNSLIRVFASDGVNTGVAVSEPFSSSKKSPQAEIIFPKDGDTFPLGDPVALEGLGFDVDDGMLTGFALRWESDVQGFLGRGNDRFLRTLTQGTHVISFRVTDSDRNQASDSVTISVVKRPLSEVVEDVAVPGDLDDDDDVDRTDQKILHSSLGRCAGDQSFVAETDYNASGCTDFNDYRVWFGFYREFAPPPCEDCAANSRSLFR
jgi:hypothetical protein